MAERADDRPPVGLVARIRSNWSARGHVDQSGSTPLYLRRAREAQEQDTTIVPQDDSIMYRESKHTLQSGAMKMKARQKPSRGESFCVGSSGVEKSVLGSSRASLSPRHATRNYENLQSKSPIDGNRSRQRGLPFSQPAFKHLSQENLVDRSCRESSDVLPNSIGGKSGPLSPAKSTPALNRVTMEDVVSSRYHSHSKPGFYSAKSSPNINQELDVSVLGEPPKLVRPSVYAVKQLNRSGLRQKSVWERDKEFARSVQHRSPLDKEFRHSPSSAQTSHHTKDSQHGTYHADTSFQPIIDKDADNRQSVPYRRNYQGHDYHNLDYSAPYKHSAGYEPSDSGSDSELEEPPAIPPPPHPATLLNPGHYPPCSPPAPPIRDLATIKVCSVNQSHEKYPSWPVTTPNARGTAQQSQPITSRAESWNDHTNTSSEFPRKQRIAYLPFQPNLRPLTEKNGSDGKSRNSSDPGLKSNVMYHAAVAKIDDVSEDGIKNFYNSMYPPPKYDSDGHNLGDKEYSVPSPPERDIPISSNKLPPSNLASPTPNQYNVHYQSSEASQSSPRNNLPRQPAKSQGTSPLQSPRDEPQPRVIPLQSSVSTTTRGQSVDRTTEVGGTAHHPPKHVDSRGYIVTPRPYYNTGTQTEVNSQEVPPFNNNDIKKDNKVDQRHADVQVNDMASQTSPKRPDSLTEQWASGERKPSSTLSAWQTSEAINGIDQIKEVESPTRRKSESWNRSASSGNLDVRVTRGRRSEVIPPSFHKDQRYKNVQEKKSQSESLHRDSSWVPPVNTHRTEESRDSNATDKQRHDGANNYPPNQRNNSNQFDYKKDKHLSNSDRVRDLESSDDFKPSIRSKYDRRSEPPLPYTGPRITGDVLEDDIVPKSEGSESSVPSYHEYTPSTAPLLRMLSKEMYGQQFSTRPHYQHDKSLSFSSQENSSRSIGSPTPSSQYGIMKEAESYSSVLIYSDASSGPLGRDDFGSQQSLGSQISLLPEGKSSDYNKDLYLDKIPSDELSPRELVRAMRNKYSFDNTFQAFKQANNPIHKYSGSESSALNYSHNYVNTYDLDSSDRSSSNIHEAMSPKSGKNINSPSAIDKKRSTMPQTTKLTGSPSAQKDSRQVIHIKQRSSGSSIDLSNHSSPGSRLNSKSSEDLRIRTPSNRDERQPPSRSQSSRNLPNKKHSSSGSSTDQSLASPLSRSEQLQIMEPQQKVSASVSETAKIAPIRQLSREELGDSVFVEESTVSSMNSDKPPQGRKRGTEKIVTRQESMKRAMGTFDEGEQTLYTTTHLSKSSKSWNNLQDAQKTNSSKPPPRSQSYANYQGMHSTRSQSDSNRLEQIQETSESPESKTSGVSRGSSYPNLSKIQQTKQKREGKTYNPKMWEDDGLLKNVSPNKSSSLKRTTSEQVRSKIQDQMQSSNIVTCKPPSSSSDRKIPSDNQNRNSDLESRKLHQQALMNFVERKKGRSVGSNSSHSSDGGSVSSPPSHKKWPSNSSETMVKQIYRSESFSDSTVSGGSDSRRHSTSSLQSQKDERWSDSPNRKDPLVKSSAGPAPSFAQEERVTPAVRLEAATGALAPRPYKRQVSAEPLKSPEDELPPALPPRNYRKFDDEPPLTQTNNLRRFSTEGRLDQSSRRFSTEGRLDQTPVRKLSTEGTKEKFDSPREDAYVDRLRLASRRLSEHVMPNPARINLINSKPASYISHSVATQPTVPQEATGIPQGQESSPVPGSPTTQDPSFQSNKTNTDPDQTKDMFLTTLKIVEEKDEKDRTRSSSPESSPDIPLPSPPRNFGEEIPDEDLPPPPDFLTEIEQANDTKKHLDQKEPDNKRYPDGSYGSHKNNRSGARPFGSYQRSSSGPFNEPSDGSDTVSQERPKRLGERAWRSVQSLPPQAASPTSTPPPDSRTGKWLSYRQQTGSRSPVSMLPRNPPHRRTSDNFQATAMKTSASFNTSVTLMSSRGSRENLTNGESNPNSPSVRDRVSNFERSKYSERLTNSANTQSPPVHSDNNNPSTSVKTNENLANSPDNTESVYNSRVADSNRNNTRISENKSPSGVPRTTNISTPPSDYNSANNKRISLENSVSNKERVSESNTPSKSSPSVEALKTVNRPETLVIIHRREKSKEEEECDRQAKLLAGQLDDNGLSQVISPPFEMRSAMDYMNGLFEVTTPTRPVNRSNSSVTRLDVSPKPVDKSINSNTPSPNNKISESPIPANSPYWISPAKAKLIERMRESDEFKLGDDDGNIEQKKEELMERINQKLEVLQRAKGDIQQDIDANNLLGKQITKAVDEKCKDQEKEKYRSFIEGLEKIVRLLLKLSGLLARAENALSCLSPDADQQQRTVLIDKRDHLLERHEEANRLKADIDKRSNLVAGILENYLNQEEIGDYMHFVDMKSRLTIEFQEIEDKITLGQEQLQALKRSMLDEK